tara:strand:+ start:269 stop:1801 length:1533 start_codon:yes stop_codon:yes gene_type:complete
MAISNPGGLLNSVPASQQQTLASNYLDFTSGSNDWAQQYLPDLMEKEAEVFGPRTISGFLSQVGAEESMTSDQVVWSEQGRLHLSYKGRVSDNNGGTTVASIAAAQILIQYDIDEAEGHDNGISNGLTIKNHGIRVNDTVIISNATDGVVKALVTRADDLSTIEVVPYGNADPTAVFTDDATAKSSTILVYGSEYGKGKSYVEADGAGATDSRTANEPAFKTFTNKPIIMKDYYEVSGSDTSRIGWVEVAAEDGQSGYLWYLKAEADTRARFNDYIEMSMLEAVDGSSDLTDSFLTGTTTFKTGTQGLFDAIEKRGNVTTGVTGVNAATDLAEFDAILAEFDSQGAIEENMLFVNRATSLAFDDMLASMNSYGAGGTSYGVFENDEDMALNLGFSGFRRGSYDFYKSDFRYLNDKATRGGINSASSVNAIRGVIIPAGTSTVYDQQLGKNLKRPFLHVRFRASQTDNRRMKTWVTGSVGAATSALDAMQLHMLTERCLVTQGANNFMLMK